MSSWALLLRAVNLGPRNKLAMADLRALLSDLGHEDVRTFLNSGNAVFSSTTRSRARLVTEIETGLRDRHGLDVRATVRTLPELATALDAAPDGDKVGLAFLFDKPAAAAVRKAESLDVSPDRLVLGDGVAYLVYAAGVAGSNLQTTDLEKLLGVPATVRTAGTVRKLLA
jgi:uncharacterized protein (DUF1697 family)